MPLISSSSLCRIAFRPASPVSRDRETMCLLAQTLQEIQRRILRRQLKWPGIMRAQPFATGIAIRPLRDCNNLDVEHPKIRQHIPSGRKLAGSAVDEQKIGRSVGGPPPLVFRRSPKRRCSSSRIIPKSSPGAIGPRMPNLR
jgi:hypothetical protein